MDANTPVPRTFEEALALYRGEDLEEYRRVAAQRAALSAEANRYRDLPPDQWPELTFNWDLSPEGQRFTLDSVDVENFGRYYPEGFRLGWVELPAFDQVLCHFSRRDGLEELWSLGTPSRLAYLIAYLAHGLPISPPLVKPLRSNEFALQGGHHRYAVAKAKKIESLPIYVEPQNANAVERIVRVNWKDT